MTHDLLARLRTIDEGNLMARDVHVNRRQCLWFAYASSNIHVAPPFPSLLQNDAGEKVRFHLACLGPRAAYRIGNHFQPIQSHIAKECRPIVLEHIPANSPRQICGEAR
jgi:hypothetical protein